ncbi:MAG: hypothetical protein Q9164_001901, partial [Protoblastenia rupestris]
MNRRLAQQGSRASNITSHDQPKNKDEPEKGMWSSMLDSVASGKKLPEKNLIVLGGTPETQKDVLETLDTETPKRPQIRHKKKPIVANDFALGYTYQDVLDADHEVDILARLSIYLLSEPSPSFAPLLNPLFTPQFIPEALLVILLDWNEPWAWVRQLRDWIVLMRSITASLSDSSKEVLEVTMKEWQEKKRGTSSYDPSGSGTGTEPSVTLPLSQGEWDEPLGLPLCVVCHNSDRINALEIEQSWREEDFDFVLQFLRTILMKHGASLIYTSNSSRNFLPMLIHSSLGIHSMLKKQALKHNVIDREKVLVPPNWDSWGKIRVLREGFDVEGVSSGWSLDISAPPVASMKGHTENGVAKNGDTDSSKAEGNILPIYESTVPNRSSAISSKNQKPTIEVSVPSMQTFLASQQETIARLAAEEENSSNSASTATSSAFNTNTTSTSLSSHERIAEHIGPVQVNMGGIQVDADDMVRKLQSQSRRDVSSSSSKDAEVETPKGKKEGASISTPEMKAQNEALQSFFSGLVKRGASNTPRVTPGKG